MVKDEWGNVPIHPVIIYGTLNAKLIHFLLLKLKLFSSSYVLKDKGDYRKKCFFFFYLCRFQAEMFLNFI